jgi:hypothetical protein
MTYDRLEEPRCSTCECVLLAPGAICHVCDVEAHFEGATRTAPPILTPLREQAPQLRSDRQAS